MASTEDSVSIPVRAPADTTVEAGQSPDGRQFVGALLRVDGGWMAVVHFFSGEGEHLDVEHGSVRAGDEPPDAARNDLEDMLRRLEPYREGAVIVSAFEVEVAERKLGLVLDRESGGMRLEPGGAVLVPAGEDQD